MDKFDICIVGAGVIGLSVARALSQTRKHSSIVVLEQESGFGQHTSSRSSEVIHAGLYYPAESLKARLCVRGKQLLYEHCDQHGIPYKRLGKYIVAQEHQTQALEQLAANAATNGVVDLSWVSQQSLQKAEPALRASSALFSPSTGILDSHSFMQSLFDLARNAAVEFAPFTTVKHIEWNLNTFTITNLIRRGATNEQYQFQSSILINCGGLYAAAIAATISGSSPILAPKIFFCKGDYFTYGSRSPLQHLVYPVPEKTPPDLASMQPWIFPVNSVLALTRNILTALIMLSTRTKQFCLRRPFPIISRESVPINWCLPMRAYDQNLPSLAVLRRIFRYKMEENFSCLD